MNRSLKNLIDQFNYRSLALRPICYKVTSTRYRNHIPANRKKVLHQFQQGRSSSQLYPQTSQPWDEAMVQAETILGDTSSFSSLRQWVSGEYTNITKYLQRLVGTNHPMLETAKRCTYIGEGRMGSAQARGLVVLLMAKALVRQQKVTNEDAISLYKKQMSLAEMTEMTYSAYMIHRGVMDLKITALEEACDSDQTKQQVKDSRLSESTINPENIDISAAKAVHYGNKVSVLCGDFLLAYVMRGLGDLHNSKVVDLMATAITEFMEGEFLLIEDWRDLNYLKSENAYDLSRWQERTSSTIGSLQANSCKASVVLTGGNRRLQENAFNFGKNLGFAWQAHTELQPFLLKEYQHIELPEMPPFPAFDLNCLPVILYMRTIASNGGSSIANFLQKIKATGDNSMAYTRHAHLSDADHKINYDQHRHQEPINYEKLYQAIRDDGRTIEETYKTIENYARKATKNLEEFPSSQAKDIMHEICKSLYSRT